MYFTSSPPPPPPPLITHHREIAHFNDEINVYTNCYPDDTFYRRVRRQRRSEEHSLCVTLISFERRFLLYTFREQRFGDTMVKPCECVYMCTFGILVDEVFNTLDKHNGNRLDCDVLRAMEFFVENKKRRFVVSSSSFIPMLSLLCIQCISQSIFTPFRRSRFTQRRKRLLEITHP